MTLPLSEIERALEAGTQGEWETLVEPVLGKADHIWIAPTDWRTRVCRVVCYRDEAVEQKANAHLIALLHNHAPAMIARIRELEGLLREVAADLRFNSDTHSAEWAGRINTALKD